MMKTKIPKKKIFFGVVVVEVAEVKVVVVTVGSKPTDIEVSGWINKVKKKIYF